MIGSEVILIPDTGEQFTRCLKTAALYSERIYCISSIAPRIVKGLFSSKARQPGEPTLRFLEATKAHDADFSLLRREGILAAPDDFDTPNPNALSA